VSKDHLPNPSDQRSDLPTWLQKLATESWQAELLISGFAIISSLQLVGLLEPMAELLLFNVRCSTLGYLKWALYYLGIGFVSLPVIFMTHFAIRVFWVGLVSLSSVFPHGIGPLRMATMTEDFVEEVRRDYPPMPRLIDKAERLASVLFTIAAMTAMVFLSIAVSLLILIAISFLVTRLSQGQIPFAYTFYAVVGITTFLWLLSLLVVSTPLKRNARANKLYLWVSRLMRKVFYGVFEYPITYLQTVLMTNISLKRLIIPSIASYLLLLVSIIFVMRQPMNASLARADDLFERASRTDRYEASRYRDQWPPAFTAIHPYLDTERVAGQELVVYLPLLGEDEYQAERDLTYPERADKLSDEQWRLQRSQHLLAAYGEYLNFRIDSSQVTAIDLQWYYPIDQHNGIRITLPVAYLPPGKHLLTIQVPHQEAKSPAWRPRAVLPFRKD